MPARITPADVRANSGSKQNFRAPHLDRANPELSFLAAARFLQIWGQLHGVTDRIDVSKELDRRDLSSRPADALDFQKLVVVLMAALQTCEAETS
jgi:hypothetical protein